MVVVVVFVVVVVGGGGGGGGGAVAGAGALAGAGAFSFCSVHWWGGEGMGGNVDDVDVVLHDLECLCGRPMAMTIPTVIALTMEMFLSVALLITLLLRRQQYKKKTRVFCSPPLHCETLDDGTAEREREREAQTLKINAKSEQQKATISAIFATLSQRTRQKPRTT